jgi:2-polyprenyl-6-methoxyphenol hydroxylase-like FAD-dependent oxidoreductase
MITVTVGDAVHSQNFTFDFNELGVIISIRQPMAACSLNSQPAIIHRKADVIGEPHRRNHAVPASRLYLMHADVPVPSVSTMHVIIIGGGLGGLCLAQGLKKEGISFSIFERDASKNARRQGYRLRINPDGSGALKANLPEIVWKLFQDTCAKNIFGYTSIDGATAKVLERSGGVNRARGPAPRGSASDVYTADRATLRDVLLTGLEDSVQFGMTFVRYEEKGDKVVAHFSDGTSVEGDLLVGADGVHSRVRRQFLPDYNPIDTDGRAIYGKTPITDELLQRFNKNATEWMTIISDSNEVHLFLEFIYFARDPADVSPHLSSVKDYAYWVLVSRSSNFSSSDEEFFSLDAKDTAALSLKMTKDWDPSLRPVLELQQIENTSVVRVTSILEPAKWKPTRVTLLGDAVHSMPPTGGVGANTALRDAETLVGVLKKSGIEGVGDYENQMREYAAEMVTQSLGAMEKTFGISMTNQRPLEYQ